MDDITLSKIFPLVIILIISFNIGAIVILSESIESLREDIEYMEKQNNEITRSPGNIFALVQTDSDSTRLLSNKTLLVLEAAMYKRQASYYGDVSFCAMIHNESVQIHNHCITGVAIRNNYNISTCSLMWWGEKDSCIRDVAIASNNKSLCMLMNYKDSCLERFAASSSNLDDCKTVRDIDGCYRDKAISQSDEKICFLIDPESKLRTSMGDGVWTDVSSISSCLSDVVEKKANISICNMINETYEKDSCYSEVAYRTKNSQLCNDITMLKWKDKCFTLTRECDKVSNQEDKDWCYKYLAQDTKDDSYCTLIVDKARIDDCYYVVAVGKEDPTACTKIMDSDTRSRCTLYASG